VVSPGLIGWIDGEGCVVANIRSDVEIIGGVIRILVGIIRLWCVLDYVLVSFSGVVQWIFGVAIWSCYPNPYRNHLSCYPNDVLSNNHRWCCVHDPPCKSITSCRA
jgi:hypothetical protein